MKPALLLVSIALLSACVAESVERRRPRKGPVKEVGFVELGGGNIRYSVEGWNWFVAGRRRDAMRKMRRNCGKMLVPQVIDEYLRQDSDIAYAGEDVAMSLAQGMEHFKIAPFEHMIYECRPKGTVYEAPRVSTAAARAILVVPPVAQTSTTTVIDSPSANRQEPPK